MASTKHRRCPGSAGKRHSILVRDLDSRDSHFRVRSMCLMPLPLGEEILCRGDAVSMSLTQL